MNRWLGDRNMRVALWVAFALLALFHLLTLSISPVVWSDEVCFNSVTVDWLQNRTFRFTADMQWSRGQEVLFYGPVFFWLDGLVISLFGNGPFTGRLLTLVTGLGVALLFVRFLRIEARVPFALVTVGLVLLLTDVFYSASLHRARMDTLAMLFYLGCAYVLLALLRRPALVPDVRLWLLSGLLYGLSLVTTFRMALFAPPLALLLVWVWYASGFNRGVFVRITAWALAGLSLLSAWLLFAFESVDDFFAKYALLEANRRAGGFSDELIRRELYVVIAVCVACVAAGWLVQKKKFFTPLNAFCIAVVMSFYALVRDTGPYSVFIMPYLYLLALSGCAAANGAANLKRGARVALALLVLFNLGVFGLRSVLLVFDAPARNYDRVNAFVQNHIPPGARVAADQIYYYAVVRNGNPYHMVISYQQEAAPVINYGVDTFDFDYLIMSDRIERRMGAFGDAYRAAAAPLDTVAVYRTEHPQLMWTLDRLGLYDVHFGSYDGVIYKRVNNEQ